MKVHCTLCDRCGEALPAERPVRSPIGIVVRGRTSFSRRPWELCAGCQDSLRTWAVEARAAGGPGSGAPFVNVVHIDPARTGSRLTVAPDPVAAPIDFQPASWDTRSLRAATIAFRITPGIPLNPKEG